nr:hypothetical protein [Planctomycetota bacterium]
DELFAGYGHYRQSSRATAYRLLSHVLGDALTSKAVGMKRPADERSAIRTFARDRLPWHARAMTHLTTADRFALRPVTSRDAIEEIAAMFQEAASHDPRNQQLCVDSQTYLPHQLLSLLDRTTMGASVEGRVPFLDHRVAEFAMTVHGRHKFGGSLENKILLRKLAARHLPPAIATRKKHGFPNSVPQWLAPDQLPRVREQLLDPKGFAADFFPRQWLHGVLGTAASLQQNALTVHSLLVLQSWHRVFVRGATHTSTGPMAATARA